LLAVERGAHEGVHVAVHGLPQLGQVRKRVFWDLHAEVAGVRLPLAARLDDVADKKAKVRFPAQHVGQIRVRPYYTDSDSLAVALSVEEEAA
ncbi:hypothetical protein ACFQ08_03385, partial [Streptosporangium algeriense]